jgi:vacuolar-type H+-ATPase subunit H
MKEKTREKNPKQIIDQDYYQRNRDKKILAAKKRYRKIKQEQEKELRKKVQKYSQVENYKVLMSFKDYSILTPEKKRK